MAAATLTDSLPLGKLVDVPEVESVLAPDNKGRLFTLHTIPNLDENQRHSFLIPNTTTIAELKFGSVVEKLLVGSQYVVTDTKQVVRHISNAKMATVMMELYRLKGGKTLADDANRIVYKVSFDITGREVYDEELFVDVMGLYFHSVAEESRLGLAYAGQAELEGSNEGVLAMINTIGLDWMVDGKNYKGFIQKENIKKGENADFYILKFDSPMPLMSGDKLRPAFDRRDASHPFHDFSPIVIDSRSVSVSGVFQYFEVRVINPK